MVKKRAVSVRLSETTIKQVDDLAKRHKVSNANVVSVLVHCYYKGIFDKDEIKRCFTLVRDI